MTRHQFRILIVFNQLCSFGWFLVEEAASVLIPEELRGHFGLDQSVLGASADYNQSLEDLIYTIFIGLVFLTVLGAAGMCFGRNWGRRLYLFCVVAGVVLTPLTPYYIAPGWGGLVSYLYTITTGALLALVYFSPVRRMFPRESEEAAG